jgi:tRNA-2-methylthio-N6-dimethylallyladenosine synthase
VVNELAVRKNKELVGTRQQVLCTGYSKTNNSRLMGRTPQNKIVIFEGDHDRMNGEIFDVLIEETTGFSLYGTAVLK